MNNIRKFIDGQSLIRASILDATEAVRQMQQIQNSGPVATLLVGRAMVGASLMASHLKDGEMVSLYFTGDGPIEKVFAEATYEGAVRGFSARPQVEIPVVNNVPNLSATLGKGFLSVIRTHPKREHSQRGTVELQSGEIGEDLAYYLQQSEQKRSAISVGVKIDSNGHVVSAGGILIELMPQANTHIEIIVEDMFRRAGSFSESLASGQSLEQILDRYIGGFAIHEIEHPYQVVYTCRCSRNRLLDAMELFSEKDFEDMIAKNENVDARCEFCGRTYSLEPAEIRDIQKQRFSSRHH